MIGIAHNARLKSRINRHCFIWIFTTHIGGGCVCVLPTKTHLRAQEFYFFYSGLPYGAQKFE